MSELTTSALETVRSAWRAHTQALKPDKEGREPRDYVWASGRRPCARWLALDLIHPDEAKPWDQDGKERAVRGEERERALRTRLDLAGPRGGFEFIEQQSQMSIRDRDGTLLITGRKEGTIYFPATREKVTLEIKSGMLVERAETLEDLDKNLYSRGYVDQLLVYLLAEGRRFGLFLLDRPGEPTWIWIDLYERDDLLQRAEDFLVEARWAIDARFGRRELPPMTDDASICRRCPHLGRSCHPGIDQSDEEVLFVDAETHPDIVTAAENILKNGPVAESVARDEKLIKKKYYGRTVIVDGRMMVTGKWKRGSKLPETLPDDVVALKGLLEEKLAPLKIPTDKGAWTWEVVPLGESDVKD